MNRGCNSSNGLLFETKSFEFILKTISGESKRRSRSGESKRRSRSKLLSENDSDLDNKKQFDLTCDIDGCHLKLRKESQLAAHVYTIHPDTQHPIRHAYLKCPNEGCFKVFPVRRLVTLNNHAKICPNLMIKTAKECATCLKTFSSVHNLKKHISGWKF